MEDRRCRKVVALCLTTAIILSVFVQNAYAGPEKSTDNVYSRVSDFKKTFWVGMISDVKESILSQARDHKLVKFVANTLSGQPKQAVDCADDDITIMVELVLPNANNGTKPAPEPEPVVERKRAQSATYSRGLGQEILREDIELLARIIHAEARGESFEGQVAVGAVVLNRVRHPSFPKTIKEVIYQPGQFTAVSDKQILLEPNEKAYLAAQAALEGQDPSNGAIFYYNPKIAKDKWIKTRSTVSVIGNHQFCV